MIRKGLFSLNGTKIDDDLVGDVELASLTEAEEMVLKAALEQAIGDNLLLIISVVKSVFDCLGGKKVREFSDGKMWFGAVWVFSFFSPCL